MVDNGIVLGKPADGTDNPNDWIFPPSGDAFSNGWIPAASWIAQNPANAAPGVQTNATGTVPVGLSRDPPATNWSFVPGAQVGALPWDAPLYSNAAGLSSGDLYGSRLPGQMDGPTIFPGRSPGSDDGLPDDWIPAASQANLNPGNASPRLQTNAIGAAPVGLSRDPPAANWSFIPGAQVGALPWGPPLYANAPGFSPGDPYGGRLPAQSSGPDIPSGGILAKRRHS